MSQLFVKIIGSCKPLEISHAMCDVDDVKRDNLSDKILRKSTVSHKKPLTFQS